MSAKASAVIAALVWAPVSLASSQAQQPVFRSATEIVVVDARVVDGNGRPIVDLTPDDFEIRVDGAPRSVVSLEYQTDGGGRTGATNPGKPQASVIFIAVDRANLRTETSREMLDAAAAFVERLPASHAIGFAVVPEWQPVVPVGKDRATIAATLRRMLGTYGQKTNSAADELTTRTALHRAIGAVSALEGRRTVIYIADRLGSSTSTTDLARRAALSGVAFYIVSTDSPVISADNRSPAQPPGDEYFGLAGLATASGGALIRRWAGAGAIFDRVAHELSGQYMLTFAADQSGDRGRHKISVKVTRSGADVRARQEFVR